MSYNILYQYLDKLSNSKVLVIGDIMLDIFVYGNAKRISPEAPVPVVNIEYEKKIPGGAANVALNLNEIGVKTSIIGLVGKDEYGKFLEHYLQGLGIETFLLNDGRPTTIKTRVIAGSQQVVRIDREVSHNLTDKKTEKVLKYIEDNLENFDGIIISDYAKGIITKKLIKKLTDLCLKQNKIITVDPKIENFFYYKGVTTLTPNNKEASTASGIEIKDERSLIKCGKYILNKLKSKSLIITRGPDGMTLFQDEKIETLPAMAKEVFDVTGAGDTVIAILTAALSSGIPLRESAIISNIAAGIVVGKVGTATVTQDELKFGINDFISNVEKYL
ncbi:MAG: D-glycero-beta-D-manno-heptose-7-phosphate kinase [Calditerrivibrio sp.]|nr:D-glycero-beta-D-manno-heptose-7-phosphate kinase [Calditerrivibrio sp.]